MRLIVIYFFCLMPFCSRSQDSLFATKLLERIAFWQVKTAGVFPKGSIPSFRSYSGNPTIYKADINSFFTSLVSFTLKDLKTDLSEKQQKLANDIVVQSIPFIKTFRNKKSPIETYNFWSNSELAFFPNGGWLTWLKKSKALADDVDDTVMPLMIENKPDSIIQAVHQHFQQYVNTKSGFIKNTYTEYKKLPTYSSWLGMKTPIEFDISVLANVLYFVQHYGLKWTSADSAALFFITDNIEKNRHFTDPKYISTWYTSTPIILYHVSRLMAIKPIPTLDNLKKKLIDDTQKSLILFPNFMDQVILGTTLMRLGQIPKETEWKVNQDPIELIEDDSFHFFIANLTSVLPNPWKKVAINNNLTEFYFYTPAYNNVLLLENLVWRKRLGLGSW